jgi:hypothetical protein
MRRQQLPCMGGISAISGLRHAVRYYRCVKSFLVHRGPLGADLGLLASGGKGDGSVAKVHSEVGSQPIAVIAGQMKVIRDDFIPRVFETMRAEITG